MFNKKMLGAACLVASIAIVPLLGAGQKAYAATTYTVPAGDVATLRSDLANAQPGDVIEVSGTYNVSDGTIATSTSGSAGNYITIKGTGSGATFKFTASAGNSAFHVQNNYYTLENLTIDANSNANKGLLIEASHGYVTNVKVKNTLNEGFKIRNNSRYWLISDCTSSFTGQSGKAGEGFYVGDADQNWKTAPNADKSGHITFLNDQAIQTKNDGFDFKEGTEYIKVIDSVVDFQNTVPESTLGNNGMYMRATHVQVINTTIENDAGTGQAFRANHMTASDGNAYGDDLELKNVTASNMAGAMIDTSFPTNTLYTDYTMTNVAGGLYASGSNIATTADPSTFSELTWSGEGGDVYGNTPSNEATFYSNVNYGGTAVALAPGSYTKSQLIAAGIANDSLSSVKVPTGVTVILYADDNFAGSSLTLTADDASLTDNNFNDLTSSIKILNDPTVFSNTSFGGTSAVLSPGNYTKNDLIAAGIGNDSISSVKVPAGFEVILYADDNFAGSSLTLTADDGSLIGDGFNDLTSSIKVLTN